MANASDHTEGKILDTMFGLDTWAGNANLYVSIHTGDPGDTAAGAAVNEIPGAGSYARQLTSGSSDWTRSASTVSNDNQILFSMAGETPATAFGFGLWTSLAGVTEAEYVGGGALAASKPFSGTDQLVFSPGNFTYTAD